MNWKVVLFLCLFLSGGPARSAALCSSVFADNAVQSLWDELLLPENPSPKLLKKLTAVRTPLEAGKPLSSGQIERLVERAFELRFGTEYKWRDYFKSDSAVRTETLLLRELKREVLARGIEGFLEAEGRLREKPLWRDRYYSLMSRRDLEALFSLSSLPSLLAGYPIYLPNLQRPLTTAELTTLVRYGLESPQGRAFLEASVTKQELQRGYALFRAQYMRVSMLVVFYLVWQQVDHKLEQASEAEGDALLESLGNAVDTLLNREPGEFPLTREDHLLQAVRDSFMKKYDRKPDEGEIRALCGKIYVEKACPERALIWLRSQ